MIHKYVKTRTIDLGAIGEVDCDIDYTYYPGSPESGCFGPPDDYDPGCDSEVIVTGIWYKGKNLFSLFPEEFLRNLEIDLCIDEDMDEHN